MMQLSCMSILCISEWHHFLCLVHGLCRGLRHVKVHTAQVYSIVRNACRCVLKMYPAHLHILEKGAFFLFLLHSMSTSSCR